MKYFVTILVVLIIGIGAFFIFGDGFSGGDMPTDTATTTENQDDIPDFEDSTTTDTTNGNNRDVSGADSPQVIGRSVDGRNIEAYHFGSGDTEVLFAAGLHGGYSWNTPLLAYRMIDWFDGNQNVIPSGVEVTVIPVLNPDGLASIVGTASGNFSAADVSGNTEAGRFNANDVDLNRNFACNWQSQSKWRDRTVDAGSSAFSEPEARALRNYVQQNSPDAAVVYFSAAGGVYTSSCNSNPLAETKTLASTYASASGYPSAGEFTAYEITGDAVDWMASVGVPGISVLLETHDDIEWQKNKAGIEAVLQQYAQ